VAVLTLLEVHQPGAALEKNEAFDSDHEHAGIEESSNFMRVQV
jgi:hypothetical protein